MSDLVDTATRSRMMSGIRGTDTRLELLIRKGMHARGYRFRLYDNDLPGKPDMVFPRYHAVIFIHGCFWHAHQCRLFKWPSSREDFWRKKLIGNRRRDEKNIESLTALGWRVLVIWECALRVPKKNRASETNKILQKAAKWLTSRRKYCEIAG